MGFQKVFHSVLTEEIEVAEASGSGGELPQMSTGSSVPPFQILKSGAASTLVGSQI
jgi:hypothetical protein